MPKNQNLLHFLAESAFQDFNTRNEVIDHSMETASKIEKLLFGCLVDVIRTSVMSGREFEYSRYQ